MILRKIEARTDGELHDLLQEQIDEGSAFDDAVVAAWAGDHKRFEAAGRQWVGEAAGDRVEMPDGRVVFAYDATLVGNRTREQLVVQCRAPDLAGGFHEDRSEVPPDGTIQFERPNPEHPTEGSYRILRGGSRFSTSSRERAERDIGNPGDWTAVISPDVDSSGDRIVARGQRDNWYGILVLDRDGRLLDTIHEGSRPLVCPNWSPDGLRVLALDNTSVDLDRHLLLIGLDGSVQELELPFAYVGCADFIAPDRLVVEGAAMGRDDPPAVWTVNLDGSSPRQVVVNDRCSSALGGVDPAGSSVALTLRCEDPLRDGLWLVDLDTGRQRHLVTGLVAAPEWSPDGSWLVFGLAALGSDFNRDVSVWLIRADGRGLQQLTEPVASWPAWLPST